MDVAREVEVMTRGMAKLALLVAVAFGAACSAPAKTDDDEAESGPQGKADLGAVDFEIWRAVGEPTWIEETSSYRTSITVCINQGRDYGNFVSVSNGGSGRIEAGFAVAIGVYDERDETVALANDGLASQGPLAPGETMRWEGPFCSGVEVEHQADDTLWLFAAADADAAIDESDEENNIALASEPLPTP
jgi:hypothetical protein